MTDLEYLLKTRAWAKKWMAVPEGELPGDLTHEKCMAVLEDAEDRLIDHLAIKGDGKGGFVSCYSA